MFDTWRTISGGKKKGTQEESCVFNLGNWVGSDAVYQGVKNEIEKQFGEEDDKFNFGNVGQ